MDPEKRLEKLVADLRDLAPGETIAEVAQPHLTGATMDERNRIERVVRYLIGKSPESKELRVALAAVVDPWSLIVD